MAHDGMLAPPPAADDLVSALVLLEDLIENVLDGQAGSKESNSIAVHQTKQTPAGAIDAGDVLQVDQDLQVRLARATGPPAALQFRDERPGQPPFDLQDQLAAGLLPQFSSAASGIPGPG